MGRWYLTCVHAYDDDDDDDDDDDEEEEEEDDDDEEEDTRQQRNRTTSVSLAACHARTAWFRPVLALFVILLNGFAHNRLPFPLSIHTTRSTTRTCTSRATATWRWCYGRTRWAGSRRTT